MKDISICCSLRPLREKVAEGRMRGAVTGQPLPDNNVTQGAVVGQALPDNALKGHLLRHAEFISASSCYLKGFTLIELLVVVMIIAILAAIAVPQYKHAVLKSRFSTVMPMAKAIADAQEVYYQGRQLYALDVDELDVTPVNAENTSVSLSQTDGYDYVMAQNSQVPGANYIIYQKYSENYPSEIHCEAKDGNEDAQWLCSALSNNNSIGKTVTAGYTTYIINGTGAGVVPGTFEQAEDDTNPMSCGKAIEMGFSCTSNETTGVKKICTTVGADKICRTKTYNEDGSYTSITCIADTNGMCTSNLRTAIYDANGNRTSVRICSTVASNNTCSAYSSGYYYTYDANGNQTSQRNCSSLASDGTCSAYSSGTYYMYDVNGNRTSTRTCKAFASDGTCNTYEASGSYDYTYNANGMLGRRCSTVTSDGVCRAYDTSYMIEYTYDANGNTTSYRTCIYVANDGTCSAYSTKSYENYDYTYDVAGRQTSSRQCSKVASDGTCSVYSSSRTEYTYDANGNQTSQRTCNSVESDGTCSVYSSGYDYTYDANGNKTSQRSCQTVASDGACSAYSGTSYYYTYDDSGKSVSNQSCSGSNINTTTGECIAYNAAPTPDAY